MSEIERHQPAAGALAEQMRYAEALSGAGLVPDSFKRQPANVLVALDIARSMHESPWTVMSEMSVIGGRPSFSAKFIRSRVRQAGHRLRETYKDGVARAVIIRADDPDFEHVAEWDEAKARQHGLWDKGHWRKNPVLMLKNRALSECAREACYEVMGGVAYTSDEVMDFVPSERVEQDEDRPAAATRAPRRAAQSNRDAAMHALGADQPTELGDDQLTAYMDRIEKSTDKDELRALYNEVKPYAQADLLHELIMGRVQDLDQPAQAGEPVEPVEAELVEGDAA